MFRTTLALIAMTAMLLAEQSAIAGSVNYVYDDGTGNSNVGPPSSFPSDPEMGWGNYFTAQPGGEMITEISFAMGPTFPVDREVHVALFDDPDDDMDPRNANLLTTATIDPPFSGDTFNVVSITPSEVSGGFFVMVYAWAEAGIDRPARQDTSYQQDVSWLIYNPIEDGVNLNDLGANAFIDIANDYTFFQGVWMIRAVGEPVGMPCPGDLDGNNVVDVFDLFELLNAWGACPGCPADLDGNEIVDVFDLFELLGAWGSCP